MPTTHPAPLRYRPSVSHRRVSLRPAPTEAEALADVAEVAPFNAEGPDLDAMYAALQADRDLEARIAAIVPEPDYAYEDEQADLAREEAIDSGKGC